jgi:hypothetical protein
MKAIKNIIFLFFGLCLLSGCFSRERMQAINTLRDIAKERAEQEEIIKQEKKKFQLLLKDIEDGTLKKGLKENEVYRSYGAPLIIRYSEGEEKNKILVFSEPLNYFGPGKVYLYLDEYNKLSSWEVK